MKNRIGLYLGVQPNAGGMFQYAQSLVTALGQINRRGEFEAVAAYADSRWEPILLKAQIQGKGVHGSKIGHFISRCIMATFCSPRTARALSFFLNPVIKELRSLKCDAWIFPAQDELSWQIDGVVISTVHDLMHRYERRFPEAGNWWRYLIREHRFRMISSESHAVLVDSDLGKRHLIESYGVIPEKVYPLRYVAPSYVNSNYQREDFDLSYRLPSKFYFYPAQFWPHKNHLRLIEALSEAKKTCSDISLVLSGGRSHSYELVQRRVSELGLDENVQFLGYVADEDMVGLYKRARALVMPTFFGPTNIPPLEAMSCGCPALLSGVYGMHEQSGDAALYFDPSSVEEMRDQMVRLWQDDQLHEYLSENARLRAKMWGEPEFKDALEVILRSVVEKAADRDDPIV